MSSSRSPPWSAVSTGQLDSIQAAIEGGRDRRAIATLVADFTPPTCTWDSEAWQTAVASDVASHIPAARLVTWSLPYRLMPFLQTVNFQEGADRVQLAPTRRDASSLSPAEEDRMLLAVAKLRADNHAMAERSLYVLIGARKNDVTAQPDDQRRILAGATCTLRRLRGRALAERCEPTRSAQRSGSSVTLESGPARCAAEHLTPG